MPLFRAQVTPQKQHLVLVQGLCFGLLLGRVDSLSAELVADHTYMSREKDHIGSPLVLSKVLCLP
jgi:hypothetical protein